MHIGKTKSAVKVIMNLTYHCQQRIVYNDDDDNDDDDDYEGLDWVARIDCTIS